MNNQYFAYIRVSTVKQGEGVSLEAQREAIERYALNQGLGISRWFEEKETAAKQGRPLFTEMIKALKAGKAKGVIMHKIDRSARNLRDWATVGDLSDAGLDVHFAAESVDFTSRGGRLTADIQAVIAADYIRNLKEEIKKGQHGRLKQGLYPFTAPFGYLDEGKGVPKQIDPVRGPLVKEMFELYATGQYSYGSLEAEMWNRGLRSVSGKKVYLSKIELILANPFYMGLVKLESYSEVFEGKHTPIVSAETFKRVQEVKRDRSRKKKTKHSYTYRGMFKCLQCNTAMIGERQRGHVYYRCHKKSCPPNCIRENALEWQILKCLSQFKLSPPALERLEQKLSSMSPNTEVAPSQIHMRKTQLQSQMDKLTDGYLNGIIDAQIYQSRKLSISIEQASIEEQEQNSESALQKAAKIFKFLEHVQSLARTFFYANQHEKRQLLELCFSNKSILAKNVEVEPQNWLAPLFSQASTLVGAPRNGETRRPSELGNLEIEDVIDALNCPEIAALNAVCIAVQLPEKAGQLPEIPTKDSYRQTA